MSNVNERAIFVDAIIREFKRGKTTGDLSRKHGLTRQGIHNILRSAGISSSDGGRSVKSERQRKRAEIEKQSRSQEERSVQRRFGCTLAQWESLRAMHEDAQQTPITLYSHNRSYANRVGIPWDITLWEWWEVWRDSGKFDERGRRSEEYCMVRIDETKKFCKNNVRVVRNDEHYRALRRKVTKNNQGIMK